MFFFKEINEKNQAVSVLTYDNIYPKVDPAVVVEITEEEYRALLAEIEAANQPKETDEISAEEALDIILGVST